MNNSKIRIILEHLQSGELDVDKAAQLVESYYFGDIGFANVDHHRSTRQGFPEVIFGQNKTTEQPREPLPEDWIPCQVLVPAYPCQTVFEGLRQKRKQRHPKLLVAEPDNAACARPFSLASVSQKHIVHSPATSGL